MANNPFLYVCTAIMTLQHVALPSLIIIFSVSGTVNVMCLFIPSAACLPILYSLEAIIIAEWAQWSPDCKMWNHTISMHTGRCLHQSFRNYGLFSLHVEVSGFLDYQLHVEGVVLYFWSLFRCITVWIVICYRELISPESSGSPCAREWCCMYQFKWPFCMKKCVIGFSMMLHSYRW